MKAIHKIIFVAVVLNSSCGRNSLSSEDCSLSKINNLLVDYPLKKDTVALQKSYECLSSNVDFIKDGLNEVNHKIVISLLMYLKKYSELETLIKSTNYPIREKEMTLNLLNALKVYKTDSLAALSFIDKNIEQIETKLKVSPRDSLLYVDYFTMLLYKSGKDVALSKVDSFKTVNSQFSKLFYESVLEDVIEEYPEEYLFPKKK